LSAPQNEKTSIKLTEIKGGSRVNATSEPFHGNSTEEEIVKFDHFTPKRA